MLLFGYPIAAGISEIFLQTDSDIAAVVLWSLLTAMGIILVLKEFMFGTLRLNTKIGAPLLIFLILYFFNLTYDLYFSNILSYMERNEYVLRLMIFVYFPCFVLMVTASNFKRLDSLVSLLFITLIIGFFLNSLAIIMDIPNQILFEGRASTKKFNPVSFGHLCGTLSLLILFRRIHLGKKSILSNTLLGLTIVGILIAGSKGPTIAFCVALLFMYIKLVGFNRSFIKNLLSIGIIVSLVTLGLLIYLDINPFVRFERIFLDSETSSVYRIFSAIQALGVFSSNPISGGASFLPKGGYPHNLALEVLMSTGLMGFGLILYAVVNAFRSKHSGTSSSCNFYTVFLVQVLVAVQTSGSVLSSGNVFFIVLIISSISRSRFQYLKLSGSKHRSEAIA